MNCTECREKLVEYTEGLLLDEQKQQLKLHLENCRQCRAELDQLAALGQRIASDAKNRQSTDFEKVVFNRIIREQNKKLKQAAGINRQLHLWRIIMKSKITKLTAAAVILIAAVLSLTLLDKTVPLAYALEQTIKACHSVRFIHMRQINPEHEDEPILIWAEFFENGQPERIRINLPEWKGGGDGAKEIIWENNIATAWMKKKNLLFRVSEKRIADEILKIVQEQDPKTYVQNLLDAQKNGKVEIQIEQPADKAEPIRITAIHLPDRDSKLVLSVDQATQLPLSGETYTLKDGNYILTNIGEFYDYNQPIDPAMFTLDNVPDDVMRIDQITQNVGLPQGQMTDDEVAVEVVRQFFQAVIDKDYAKASQMYEGIPAAMLEKANSTEGKILEIVSVGPVQPHPIPQTGGVIVPCTLKIEENGQIHEQTFDKIGVRQVYNQPGRWTIFGGL